MIYINPSWTYKETIEHIRKIKAEYQGILSAFSMWEKREWANFICNTKTKFYNLNLLEWQKDNLWKFMNDYIPFSKLKLSAKRYK